MATRADIVAHGDYYLVPLPEVRDAPTLHCECLESE